MHNEDTGEGIRCPYCGAVDADCPHLLAVVDVTFDDCVGGFAYGRYRQFRDAMESAFLAALERGSGGDTDWCDADLNALWSQAIESFKPGDQTVDLDGSYVNSLVGDLFLEAGAGSPDGPIVDEGGGPGLSSAMTVYFAEEPAAAFETAMSLLRGRLQQPPGQQSLA